MRYSPGCEGFSPLLFTTGNVDFPGCWRLCSAACKGILTGGENNDVSQPTPGMQPQNSRSQGTAELFVVRSVFCAALSIRPRRCFGGAPAPRIIAHTQHHSR